MMYSEIRKALIDSLKRMNTYPAVNPTRIPIYPSEFAVNPPL